MQLQQQLQAKLGTAGPQQQSSSGAASQAALFKSISYLSKSSKTQLKVI